VRLAALNWESLREKIRENEILKREAGDNQLSCKNLPVWILEEVLCFQGLEHFRTASSHFGL